MLQMPSVILTALQDRAAAAHLRYRRGDTATVSARADICDPNLPGAKDLAASLRVWITPELGACLFLSRALSYYPPGLMQFYAFYRDSQAVAKNARWICAVLHALSSYGES